MSKYHLFLYSAYTPWESIENNLMKIMENDKKPSIFGQYLTTLIGKIISDSESRSQELKNELQLNYF